MALESTHWSYEEHISISFDRGILTNSIGIAALKGFSADVPNDRCFAHLRIAYKQDLQGTVAVVSHLRVDHLTHLRHYRMVQGKSQSGNDLKAIWAEPPLHRASLPADQLQSSGILFARLLKTGINPSVCLLRVSQANKRPLTNAEKSTGDSEEVS